MNQVESSVTLLSCDVAWNIEYNTLNLDHNYCFTSLAMTFLELQTLWQCMGETFWTCRSYQAIYPMAREPGCLVVLFPAGKIGGKIHLVTLCTILGTNTSVECHQGVNWCNWSHTEARIVNECTCSSYFPSSELQGLKNAGFLLTHSNSCLNVWKFEEYQE